MNGFKKTVLTATAVMVLGMSANAQALLIDSFDTAQGPVVAILGTPDSDTTTIDAPDTSLGLTDRTLSASVTTNNSMDPNRQLTVVVGFGELSYSADSGVIGTGIVNWMNFNGVAGSAVDLTAPGNLGTGILVTVLESDAQGVSTATFTLTKMGGGSLVETLAIPNVINGFPQGHLFTFGGLFNAQAQDITNIELKIDGVSNLDVRVDLIGTEVVPEPGTMLLMGSGLLGLGLWRRFKK